MNLYTVGTKYPEFITPSRMDFERKGLITVIVAGDSTKAAVDAFKIAKQFAICLHYYRGQILLAFKAEAFDWVQVMCEPHWAAVLSREELMAYQAEGALGINLFYVDWDTGELLEKKFLTASQEFHEALVAAVKDKLSRPYDEEKDREILEEVNQELPDPLSVAQAAEIRVMLLEVEGQKMAKKIFINNFEKVEAYLELDPVEDEGLHSLELRENNDVRGIGELLALLPETEDQASLQAFYEKTGLNIRVEQYRGGVFTMLDRNGTYPREFLNVKSPDLPRYAQEVDQHPEWFEPQEGADIIIRDITERIKYEAQG